MKRTTSLLLALLLTVLAPFLMGQWATGMLSGSPPAATPPAYGVEVTCTSPGGAGNRWQETASGGTTVITITTAVAAGVRVVLPILWVSATQTLTSVTDSRSNSYANDTGSYNFNTTDKAAIASSVLTTPLQSGDTITITWGSAAFTYRYGSVQTITNSSGVDQTKTASSFGTAIAAAASTTATKTSAIGMVVVTTTSHTYGSGNWTTIGSATDYGSTRTYYLQKDLSSAGSQDPGGTLSGNDTWGAIWAAYK